MNSDWLRKAAYLIRNRWPCRTRQLNSSHRKETCSFLLHNRASDDCFLSNFHEILTYGSWARNTFGCQLNLTILPKPKYFMYPLLWCIYRGYYTVARRYEFYFRVAKEYFTNERSEWVKCCFCHEKIKFIASSRRVMFFLLYRHANDGVFDDFPKISEDFPKLFRIPDERSRTFSENFRRCPKVSEDFRGRPEDVSMIHQRI